MVAPRFSFRLNMMIMAVAVLYCSMWVRAIKRDGYFVTHDPRILQGEAIALSWSWPFLVIMGAFPLYVFYRIFSDRAKPIKEDGEKLGLLLMLVGEILGVALNALYRMR